MPWTESQQVETWYVRYHTKYYISDSTEHYKLANEQTACLQPVSFNQKYEYRVFSRLLTVLNTKQIEVVQSADDKKIDMGTDNKTFIIK